LYPTFDSAVPHPFRPVCNAGNMVLKFFHQTLKKHISWYTYIRILLCSRLRQFFWHCRMRIKVNHLHMKLKTIFVSHPSYSRVTGCVAMLEKQCVSTKLEKF
jgi:hypothetical protein